VHRDSPINNLDDMFRNGKNLTFGAGDPQSTSGTLVPGYYVFAQRGVEAKDTFKVVRPASHGINLLAVINKQVDVATNNSEELDKLQLKDPEKRKEVKIIWTSPLIPRDPLVWRKDLPADQKAKIKAFIIGYGKDQREKDVLKGMQQIAGFKESSNAQLIPIRQLEYAKDRAKVAGDTTLSDAEKSAKIRDIDAKLAELAKQAK
jgi:phosphonate transport system substrate-binding protein